jgi:hypothetical protein
MNADVALVLAVILGVLSVALAVAAMIRRGARQIDDIRSPFDRDRARREAHALDLPFPESDGTLSRRPETTQERDARTHADLHARRWSAEELSDLRPGGPTGEAELIGSAVMWHAEGCRCIRGVGPRGPVILSKDRRCLRSP